MTTNSMPLLSEETFDFACFGDRLRWSLARKGMRQIELGIKVGLTKAAVNQHCLSKKPSGGGKKVVEMAEVLDVPVIWLQFGPSQGVQPDIATPGASTPPFQGSAGAREVLSSLQEATLNNLAKVMAAGDFDDLACLELLQQLKQSLTKLAATPPKTKTN